MKTQNLPGYAIETESTLKTIANVILFLGIIGGIIYGCFSSVVKVSSYESVFNPAGLINGLAVCFESVVAWAVLKVLAEISITLKRIFHFHQPSFYKVNEEVEESTPEKGKVYIWLKTGEKVKFSYKLGGQKFYTSLKTYSGVGSIDDSELEEVKPEEEKPES